MRLARMLLKPLIVWMTYPVTTNVFDQAGQANRLRDRPLRFLVSLLHRFVFSHIAFICWYANS